ncbi:unnamed protein product, partial [Mesorhabditis belari]|uniref:Uncharacterized protein n=1 Tax=Mesorhabditis belari TaxID=2138241 RepID=A0AAF3J511_9BILA
MRVFESLNCIACKEPFARVANQPRSPRHLYCGLAMCNECFEKEETLEQEKRNHRYVLSQESALVFTPMGYLLVKPFKIPECSICHDEYSNEIEAKKSLALRCNECHEKNIIDKMFYCSACSFEVCGACAYVKHHLHGATPLLKKKANQMLTGLQQKSRNVIKTCKYVVPELHKGLFESIDIFETKLLSKEETLKDASTFADLREKHESFTKIKSKFESSAENYLPHLRKFDKEVKELIQTLDETPDIKKSK